jgi:hypothetical protein
MGDQFHFTFENLKKQFEEVLNNGYKVTTCYDYIGFKKSNSKEKVLVSRVDIDISIKKAERLSEIFNDLGFKSTFFIRMHASEYNPFSFEAYRIIKTIIESGHELGYHSEVIDQSTIWNENASECLSKDIYIINKMFGIKIKGIASHGGLTGLNNLDFWKDKKASDFGLAYEAYDTQPEFNLFHESFYVSDSEWTRWKCYNKGMLVQNDRRSLAEHSREGHRIMHSLIHPETYFDRHFYE